jgi:hypothetical protein
VGRGVGQIVFLLAKPNLFARHALHVFATGTLRRSVAPAHPNGDAA